MAKIVSNGSKINTGKTGFSKGRSDSERQEIEALAYQFFIERGCQHGNDGQDWARAESIVRSRRS